MNLTGFKEQVNRQGLAKNSRWEVRLYPPPGLTDNIFSTDVGPFKIQANLPGIDLLDNAIERINNSSLNVGPFEFGSDFNIPTLGYTLRNHGSFIECLNLYANMVNIPGRDVTNYEFRENGESRNIGFMHNHSAGVSMSYYCSEDMRERMFFEKWQNLMFNPVNKLRAYYEDYIGTMEIIKYDTSWSEVQAIYKMTEVYPSNVAAQNMQFAGTDTLKLDINFKYRTYERIK